MKTYIYTKQANLRLLQQELIAAEFQVIGLTQDHDTWKLIVGLDDAETKDPTAVVTNHVYWEDSRPNLENAMASIRATYVQAHDEIAASTNLAEAKVGLATLGEALKKLARLVAFIAGTIELDNTEYQSGELNLDK